MASYCDRNATSADDFFQRFSENVQDKDPIRAGFLQRLRTFNTINWAGKPIDPLVLASHGWALAEEDVLKCSRCNQYLSTKLPFQGEANNYKEACRRLKEKLTIAHSKFCIFHSKDQATENLAIVETISNKELISQLQAFVESKSGEYSLSLPRLEEVKKAFNWFKETHVSDCDWSSFVLFLAGWSLVKEESGVLDHLLECCFCNRKWSVESYLVNEDGEDNSQAADPVSQHQPWCAWRNGKKGWESRLEQCLKMMENAHEGTESKHTKRYASLSEDMTRIRKMLKGTP